MLNLSSSPFATLPLRPFDKILIPLMTASGQTRSFGDVGSSVRFAQKRQGWTIYEYTPLERISAELNWDSPAGLDS